MEVNRGVTVVKLIKQADALYCDSSRFDDLRQNLGGRIQDGIPTGI